VTLVNDADAAGVAEMTFGVGKGVSGIVMMVTVGTGIGTALFLDGKLFANTELGHIEIRGKDAELRASDAVREREDLGWKEWAERFDEYLTRLAGLFWPDLFIIGGGVSKKAEKFLPHLTVNVPIQIAALKNEAGIVGAALTARRAFEA
jgi:polyphosphate glucokinase